ncbi:hypothetical protein AcV7_005918 [Taiwanofungus camphoratus]|nr:hypothetical protein AcV7_005918 [Antrodia cinnamomea]
MHSVPLTWPSSLTHPSSSSRNADLARMSVVSSMVGMLMRPRHPTLDSVLHMLLSFPWYSCHSLRTSTGGTQVSVVPSRTARATRSTRPGRLRLRSLRVGSPEKEPSVYGLAGGATESVLGYP